MKLTENMLAAIAQFDNGAKAERTKAGMIASIQCGRWTWRAPLGHINGRRHANAATSSTLIFLSADSRPAVPARLH
jgi:DNA invertase Pin-like site-specific DNA recombinase